MPLNHWFETRMMRDSPFKGSMVSEHCPHSGTGTAAIVLQTAFFHRFRLALWLPFLVSKKMARDLPRFEQGYEHIAGRQRGRSICLGM